MPVMKSVYSSHVNRIGYDPETQELHVEWDTGKTSAYDGVPEGVAHTVMNAASIGKGLIEHVKPKFPHRYVQ